MMNIVAHNLLAMNANRQFGITSKKKAKSTEKLSSGYKINRAADDAAGLSISEKMRRQIRGLNKAEENIQDGISLCQVADGALNETHDILQRMNELAVKAGNDTNSQTDRAFIQTEIDALTAEIDRIANQTTFNEEIYPLLGKEKNTSNTIVPDASSIRIDENGTAWILPEELKEYTATFGVFSNQTVYVDDIEYNSSQHGTITVVGYQPYDAPTIIPHWFGRAVSGTNLSNHLTLPISSSLNKEYSLFISDLKVNANGHVYYVSKLNGQNVYPVIGRDENGNWLSVPIGVDLDSSYPSLPQPGHNGSYVLATRYNSTGQGNNTEGVGNGENVENRNIFIHMATEPGIGMFIDLVNATAKGIGVDKLDVSSMENAGNAINAIKGAIEKISGYRNVFGSQQNRLEHAMRVNANIAENTTDAESRIRDTDVAKEMLTFSNENILAQTGQSMLSQANQSQQNILSLLS